MNGGPGSKNGGGGYQDPEDCDDNDDWKNKGDDECDECDGDDWKNKGDDECDECDGDKDGQWGQDGKGGQDGQWDQGGKDGQWDQDGKDGQWGKGGKFEASGSHHSEEEDCDEYNLEYNL